MTNHVAIAAQDRIAVDCDLNATLGCRAEEYLCRPAPLVGTALALSAAGRVTARRFRGASGEWALHRVKDFGGEFQEGLRREVLRVNGPRHLSVGAEFVERIEDSDDVPTFSGALVKLFKALQQLDVFGAYLLRQVVRAFAECFERLGIVFLLSLRHLLIEITHFAIVLRLHFITADESHSV